MIVGLCGYAQVGKDTIGAALENYKRLAFADALKHEVLKMLLLGLGIKADLWGKDKEEWRDMLVFWGAKRRAQAPDYWIKQLILRNSRTLKGDRCVITDVRYANEVLWIQKHKGLVIRLERPGFGPTNDEERRSFKEIDCLGLPTVHNDGTPEQAAAAVRKMIKAHNIQQGKLCADIGW